MKRSRYTEEQITYALRQAESGMPVSDVCRQIGIAEATFYIWKRKCAKLGVTELRAGKLTDLFLNFQFHALARSVRHIRSAPLQFYRHPSATRRLTTSSRFGGWHRGLRPCRR